MNRTRMPMNPSPAPMNRRRPPMNHAQLRATFTEAGRALVPSPVPLAAIEREGRARRRRRRVAVVVTGCLLLLAPLGFISWRMAGVPGPGQAAPSASVPAGTVRVVAPGERVRPLSGVELWLTKDGAHWSAPSGAGEFLPVGGLARDTPAVTVRLEAADGRLLLSGIHHGGGTAARVEVTTPSGRTTGTLLTLAGGPGWDVWYATAELPTKKQELIQTRVTVYDADGKVLARAGVGR